MFSMNFDKYLPRTALGDGWWFSAERLTGKVCARKVCRDFIYIVIISALVINAVRAV